MLHGVWEFIDVQLLKMQWLDKFIGELLVPIGLDEQGRSILQFFLYDVIKISLLLVVLIFLISYIQSYFPPERTRVILSNFNGVVANILAALLGTVTPFCSCSSIPLFIGFSRAGLPLGVTFSFLISSPMVDLASLILLMSIFGWKIAVTYVFFGLVIAVVGGTVLQALKLERYIEEFILSTPIALENSEHKMTIKERVEFAKDQVVFTFKKVFPYILFGVGIGALIHNWIPEEWIIFSFGKDNPYGVIMATLISIPIYADIFGTIPIAQALLSKGAELGTVLAFMMGVTTLSLPSLIMLRRAVKWPLLSMFVVICGLGIIIVGYLFNLIAAFLM